MNDLQIFNRPSESRDVGSEVKEVLPNSPQEQSVSSTQPVVSLKTGIQHLPSPKAGMQLNGQTGQPNLSSQGGIQPSSSTKNGAIKMGTFRRLWHLEQYNVCLKDACHHKHEQKRRKLFLKRKRKSQFLFCFNTNHFLKPNCKILIPTQTSLSFLSNPSAIFPIISLH